MNKVILSGRVTRDAELSYIPNAGVPKLSFGLAVERNYQKDKNNKKVDFINMEMIGQHTEKLAQYVTKGQQLAVRGSWRTGNFKKEDGTTAYTNELFVEGFDFIGGQNSNGNNNSNYNTGSSNISDMGFGLETPVDDGDMPF